MTSTLLDEIAQIAMKFHPNQVEHLAEHIRNHGDPVTMEIVAGYTIPLPLHSALETISHCWKSEPQWTKEEIAVALLAASQTHVQIQKNQQIELVWTGPETSLVPVRKTQPVLLEVIEQARRSLWITSFVAYEVPAIRDAIAEAISRNVSVNILLELSESKGGTVSFDSIAKAKKVLPGCKVYSWNSGANPANDLGKVGSMHAKCAVADEGTAFITSANITFAAIERNMELGVLIRGGSTPKQLQRHLQALCATDIVVEASD